MRQLPQRFNWRRNGSPGCNIKILHVVPTYLPATRYGGPIQSVHGLCNALSRRGHHVEVFTTNVDGESTSDVRLEEMVNVDDVQVTYFSCGFPRRLYRSPGMARLLERTMGNFDLVHIHSVFLWPGFAASRVARKYAIPYVVSPRGMLVPELIARKSKYLKTAWLRMFDQNMLKNASGIHVTTMREAQDLKSLGLELPEIFTVPNGVDFPPGANQRLECEFILYLGRLDPKKSIEVLIEALAHIQNVRLVVAGAGDTEYLNWLKINVSRLGLEARVEFIGHIDDASKWSYYLKALVLVLPSVSENFANVVLEAMAVGCPVIVSPGVGLAEIVSRHQCGLVVDRDPLMVAAAIRQLMNDPDLRNAMGVRGAEVARRDYSWSTVAGQMIEEYEFILSRHATSGLIAQ